MASRPPSVPPQLAGFDYIKLLGSGGFADVFLYQQLHPRRQVAVKVLLKERMGGTSVDGFTEEANLMAQFASHPSIVSVYQAGVADDGRPYLVMEYCSRPNLQARHRRERFSEAETLRIGIQIAGAIETAHRAGILHRDIKPANILVTEYGRPALTDFGISATTTGAMTGMSIPWSPPESLRNPPQGFPSSDVYALAATLFTLLTNRTPFEVPGASNTELDVMARIQSMPVPGTGRADVSAGLQAVLERAMAKDPASRYASAIEFARALQRVQRELGMQPTPIDVVEEEVADDGPDDSEEKTRFRGVTSIDAQAPRVAPAPPSAVVPPLATSPSGTLPSAPGFVAPDAGTTRAAGPALDRTVGRPASGRTLPPASIPHPAPIGPAPSAPPLEHTMVRSLTAPSEADAVEVAPHAPMRRRRVSWWVTAAALAIVAVGVTTAVLLNPTGVGVVAEEAPAAVAPQDAVLDSVAPQVEELTGSSTAAGVVFTWTNPDPADGDVYLWRPVVPGEEFPFQETDAETATVPPDAAGRACIEVVLRRADGTAAAQSAEECAP